MKNPVFTGAAVAIITPMYEDGSVNFDELGRIIEDQIARGTDAVVICGTTGECSTMTADGPMSSGCRCKSGDSLFHPKVRWGEDKHFQCSAWRLER